MQAPLGRGGQRRGGCEYIRALVRTVTRGTYLQSDDVGPEGQNRVILRFSSPFLFFLSFSFPLNFHSVSVSRVFLSVCCAVSSDRLRCHGSNPAIRHVVSKPGR